MRNHGGVSKTVGKRASARLIAVASMSVLGIASSGLAANTVYQWTGDSGTPGTFNAPVSGNWSDPLSWQSNGSTGIPISGSTTELDFSGSGSTGYTSTFDSALFVSGAVLTGPFSLNEVQLSSTASAPEIITPSAANYSTNVLNFSSNGTTTPQLLQNGTGAFTFNTGLTLSNTLKVAGTGTGALNLTGNISGAGGLTLGYAGGVINLSGSGTYTGTTTFNGGTVNYIGSASYIGNSSSNLDVGNAVGTTSVVNFNSTGVYNFSNGVNVADNAANSAAINLNSGTLNLENPSGSYVSVGNSGYGSLVVSGSSLLNVGTSGNSTGLRVGTNGATALGIYTQTGGTVVLQRYLAVANGGVGIATLTGGTLTVFQTRSLVGDNTTATSVLNLGTEAGGNNVFSTTLGLEIQDQSGITNASLSTTNLNAGTLILGSTGIYTASVATLNLNGATIANAASNANLINGSLGLAAHVYNGGVAFNIGSGATDTVTANLLATTGSGIYVPGGVVPVAAGSGGAGYIGAPQVTVIGGGTGATAIANVTNGVITGVTITSPGQGYSAGPITFNFSGGGATTPVTTYTTTLTAASVVPNSTGGVNVTGAGVLSLAGTNTYTGPTTITSGELNLANTSALPSSSSIVFAGGALQYTASNLTDYSPNFSTAPGQAYSIDTNSQNISFATALTSTGGSLTKLGAGSLTLTAPATYSGSTTINGGKLVLPAGVGLASNAVTINSGGTLNAQTGTGTTTFGSGTGTLNIVGGGTLDMTDGNAGQLNINSGGGTALTLGSATGTVPASLLMEVGAPGSSDNIAANGAVSVLSSGAQFKLTPLTGFGVGTYTLITGTSGLGSAGFSLYAPVVSSNGTIYDLSLANSTATQETLTVSVDTSVLALYWAGSADNKWTTASNWQTDATSGVASSTTPGAGTNVFFDVSGSNQNNATSLNGSTFVNSLTFTGTASSPVSIAAGNTLTIYGTTAGGNTLGNGITMNSGGSAVTINAPIALGGNQTWTNNDTTNALVVAASISGNYGITQAGAGTLTLAGANTFNGGVNTSGGTLNLNNAAALGSGTFAISGPVVLDNTTAGAITLSTNNPQTWGSSFTFNGTNSLNLGSGAVSMPASITLTAKANTLTVGGTITDGNAGNTLTTTGSGTITFAGAIAGATSLVATGPGVVNFSNANSSYTGNTNISSGTANFSGAAGYNGGGALLVATTGGTTAVANFNSSGTFVYNTAAAAGYGPSSYGAINQSSGTLNLTPNGSLLALGGAGYLELGVNSGTVIASYGSYVMAGGTLNTLSATGIRVGDGGIGVFTQTGGVINISRYFATTSPGNGANSGGDSVSTFTGGTFNTSAGYNVRVQDNSSGVSLFNIGTFAGGNVKFNNIATGGGGGMEVTDGNSDAGGAGILNLNSGTLQLQSPIYKGAVGVAGLGSGAFVNLNGATIQAGANNVTLIDNSPDAVQVYNGGITFDSNGFNGSNVSANLQGAGQTGFYTTTIPVPAGQGGSGYIGAPYVNITGGSGNSSNNGYVGDAATAIANVTNGAVTSVTLTSPGQGYVAGDQLSFNFNGGGSTAPANSLNYTVQSGDIAANNKGGVIKIGTGSVTLSGSNTFSGNTQVKAGTLVVGGQYALGTGSAILSSGTTLALGTLTYGTTFNGYQLNGNSYIPQIGNSGTTLKMTVAAGSIATSAFNTTPVTISDTAGFVASFTYTHSVLGASGVAADGVTFCIQNEPGSSQMNSTGGAITQQVGPSAYGGTGGSLGYTTDGTLPAIEDSVAAGIDIYHDQLQVGENGVFVTQTGTNSDTNLSQYATSNVVITYNGSTQTLTESVTTNGQNYTSSTPNVDIAQLLGGTAGGSATGYIGFTGGTGAVVDNQTISNFNFGTTAGTLTTSAIGVTNPVTVLASSTATLQLSQTTPYGIGTVGPITIGSGSSLSVSIGSNAPSGVTHGVLVTPSITFQNASSGTLNLMNNAIDITAQSSTPTLSLAAVTGLAASGFNKGGWNGSYGIISSTAAADPKHLTAVGVILNDNGHGTPLYGAGGSISSTFDGETPADGDVLVKYTYYGDANLDGAVDGSDYSLIDAGFNSHGTQTGWYNGDFNYDGKIDGSDYTLIDNAFNTQGASLGVNPAALVASSTAQLAGGTSAVPEPATLGVLALGALGFLSRRRTRSSAI